MNIESKDIIAYLEENASDRPVSLRALADNFGIQRGQIRSFQRILKELAREGKIEKHPGRRFQGKVKAKQMVGRFQGNVGGYGFVIPDSGVGEDVFIPPREARSLMDGDRVVVEMRRRRTGERERTQGKRKGKKISSQKAGPRRGMEGRIVEVVEKASRELVGQFESSPGGDRVIPDGKRLPFEIYIPRRYRAGALPYQMVVVRVTRDPDQFGQAEGKIIEVLGNPDDSGIDNRVVKRKFRLPEKFPRKVLAESQGLPRKVRPRDMKDRVDLRGISTVTIDGEDAKDFDDAVAIERTPEEGFRLLVSIADVSHFVPEGSALDQEALHRGTSVYFPGQVMPMLPPALSDHLCSLKPSVNRLTLTVEMIFDRKGERLQFTLFPSLIRSAARLTYAKVWDVLSSEGLPRSQRVRSLVPSLRLMEELALMLREKRRRRGSLDFDLPEPEIIMDLQGRVENVFKAERTVAHQIIEEFMIAANEAVDEFLYRADVPSLHRVHEEPDEVKIKELSQFLRYFGLHLEFKGKRRLQKDINRILQQAEGRAEESLINHITLRAMKQARYASEPLGHFGLASELYTHFTSPIRRYPDLVIHRILKEVLNENGSSPYRIERLTEIAMKSSEKERIAVEAERDIIAIKKARFIEERIGEEFPGIVFGITRGGIKVELIPYFVAGVVPLASLTDDFYMVDEPGSRVVGKRTGRIFKVGDEVVVQVDRVSVLQREIVFALVYKVQ